MKNWTGLDRFFFLNDKSDQGDMKDVRDVVKRQERDIWQHNWKSVIKQQQQNITGITKVIWDKKK